MIIDKITLAGDDAYFTFPIGGGQTPTINPAGLDFDASADIPTAPLDKGKQYVVSAISLQLEGDDLRPLFYKQDNAILQVNVYKEIFTNLFADPFEHRVHNISGYEDLNQGAFQQCRSMDIEGIPTLISVGDGDTCSWVSAVYTMPDAVTFDKIAWDLGVSRLTPQHNFTYSITLSYWTSADLSQQPTQFVIAANADPSLIRIKDDFTPVGSIFAYQLSFSATIQHEANVYEAHTFNVNETVGTPMLRAIYLLEQVNPAYKFYSLKELLDNCSESHLLELATGPVTKLMATLAIPAVLVQSDNQIAASQNNPAKYEHITLSVFAGAQGNNPAPNPFKHIEARAHITESITPPKPIF